MSIVLLYIPMHSDHFVVVPNRHTESQSSINIQETANVALTTVNTADQANTATSPGAPKNPRTTRRRSTIPRLRKNKSIQNEVEVYQLSVLTTAEDTNGREREVCEEYWSKYEQHILPHTVLTDRWSRGAV